MLIAGLMWFFTQPLRHQFLLEQVNARFADLERSFYLEKAVPPGEGPKTRIPLGVWYTLRDSNQRALVFSLIAGGISYPCVALVSEAGGVDEIIPLLRDPELPPGLTAGYIRRIEWDAQEEP